MNRQMHVSELHMLTTSGFFFLHILVGEGPHGRELVQQIGQESGKVQFDERNQPESSLACYHVNLSACPTLLERGHPPQAQHHHGGNSFLYVHHESSIIGLIRRKHTQGRCNQWNIQSTSHTSGVTINPLNSLLYTYLYNHIVKLRNVNCQDCCDVLRRKGSQW